MWRIANVYRVLNFNLFNFNHLNKVCNSSSNRCLLIRVISKSDYLWLKHCVEASDLTLNKIVRSYGFT